MPLYQKVVVAVDLQKESQLIVEKAKTLLSQSAELHLLHVVEPMELGYFSSSPFSTVIVDPNEIEKDLLNARRAQLTELARQCELDKQFTHLIIGKASREIKKFADKVGCQLIVMGSHSQHAWEFLLGSTANGVLQGTPCDVLTVRMRD